MPSLEHKGSLTNKETCKQQLTSLILRYNEVLRGKSHAEMSEETIRTWLNEFLLIFGWNVQNPNQVIQERILQGSPRQRLESINSPHKKPDYILINGKSIKTFLDAKSLDVDIFRDKDVAYQIRSYGWSAKTPCAFVSNFEQFVIYDTRFIPSPEQPADYGVIQISIDSYLDKFDLLYDYLEKTNICSNNLEKLYSIEEIEGKNLLDVQFMDILSTFRKKLAKNLIKNNPKLGSNLNYYVQIILDRIIFIRVCESKQIEEPEKLKKLMLSPDGFWKSFRDSCYMEFYDHYDGALFFKDNKFQNIVLDDITFTDFINTLYYPNPYKFDVIPVQVIAGIYEEFLGKKLVVENNSIKEILKSEYIKTNGAVPTPAHLVELVERETIKLENIHDVETLLQLKILDPCCGSGAFLIVCFDLLSKKLIQIFQDYPVERDSYPQFLYIVGDEYYLTIAGRRAIIKQCIYALDKDEAAIEVAKMSLALKIVDGNNPVLWEGMGVFGAKVLAEIADNIKLGNTLVDTNNNFTQKQICEIEPCDIKSMFGNVFKLYSGFSYIVGNPPYVETKHYKLAQPEMHAYLSENYTTFNGKADLAILFIERCLQLLNENGSLGFIIQRRWFKTAYGEKTRLLINTGKKLKKVIDFQATGIFKRRTVYVSVIVLSNKPQTTFSYVYNYDPAENLKDRIENGELYGVDEVQSLPMPQGNAPWNFEQYELEKIKNALTKRLGTLGDFHNLSTKDGIQALWKKIYHLHDVSFSNNIGCGKNGFNETVPIERALLKGVIYNHLFYPFKAVEPNAYCLFPYKDNSNTPLTISELKHRFLLLTHICKKTSNG